MDIFQKIRKIAYANFKRSPKKQVLFSLFAFYFAHPEQNTITFADPSLYLFFPKINVTTNVTPVLFVCFKY
jgi:hypothetical protein